MKDSISRIAALARLSVVLQVRNILIAAAGTFSALLVFIILASLGGTDRNIHTPFFGLLLFVGGYITTSLAFIDLHIGHRSASYILLPASAGEKVAERVITTNAGYVIVAVAAYALFTIVSSAVTSLLVGRSFGIYLPVDHAARQLIYRYMLSHAIVLFGAVYFRRKNLLKTAASITAIVFGLGFFTAGVVRVVFGGPATYFHGPLGAVMIESDLMMDLILRFTRWTPVIQRTGKVVYYLLTPAFWFLTWLRLRETEVTHGV